MISIVIVGYNSRKDLKDCFDSIFQSSYKRFKIIYVDNGSSDGSYEFVRENYSKIIAIKNKNTGYAGGNNVGIKYALRHNMSGYPYRSSLPARRSFNEVGSRTNFSIPRLSAVHSKNKTDKANTKVESHYVFVLNPDTIVDTDCLKILAQKAEEDRILQPLILIFEKGKRTNLINTTGSHLNFMGISYCSNYRKRKQTARKVQVACASGAGFLIPVSVLKDIGLFKERFFMYHEDVDLSWRARMAGYEIYLQNKAIVYHKYSFSKSKKKYYFAERNRLDFIFSNFEAKTILLIIIPFLVNEILITLYSIIDGWFFYKVASSFTFLFNLRRIASSRKKLKRRVSDKQLVNFISGKVSFSEKKIPLQNLYNQVYCTYWNFIKKLI